ncbi:ABC transporter family substrate-binding protein [Devriesea agamarum]|uniref:ABC transporter family substrate-binding protein n=1 Tax=Devriesea agamarum TaxID=472569 RepID=UPI00071C5140|nr:ABC transporter family substrate-binding protein [Devriesea agamarum]
MKLTRRTLFGASALSAVALAGCSKAEDGSNGGGGKAGGTGEQIAADKNDINPKKRDEIGEGGSLRLTNNAYPPNWNPYCSDGNEKNTSEIMRAIFPVELWTADAKGNIGPNLNYLKRMEKVKDEPLTIEIELRPDLKWSDGTLIDYKSIENVFTIMNGSKPAYQIASSEGYDKVEKIEQGKNNLTAVVTFKEPWSDWMGLPAVMPDSLAASAEAFNTGWIDAPKVTAGPYKLGKLDPGNKTVTLVPDENWSGDKPFLKQILWTTIEDPAAAATSFKNGQLDALNNTVPAMYSVVKDMVGKNGIALRKAAGPSWTHITLNGAKGRPLEDVHVRRAVFNAINRKDTFLSVNATMPYPKDNPQLNNHMLMTNQEGYKDNSGDYGKFDPEAAKKHLEEAGYKIENGKAVKDGKPLEITYVYNDGSKTNEAVVPIVQKNLQEIGITMRVQKVPPTDLFSKYVIPGNFDLSLYGWVGNPFFSSGDAIWRSTGQQNYGKVGDAEVDKLLDKAAKETDDSKRISEANEIDTKLWELAGTLPLWQSFDFYTQDETLANFGARGFEMLDWTKIGYAKGSPKLKS